MKPWDIRWADTPGGGVTSPISYLLDVRELRTTFGEVILSMASATRGSTQWMTHENLVELVIVTQSDIIRLAANASGQSQYGNVKARAFETVEDALAYIDQQTT